MTHVEPDAALLQLVGPGLELDVGRLVVGGHRLERRVEERVHERRLAQPRLADAHHVEGEPAAHRLVHQLQRGGSTVEFGIGFMSYIGLRGIHQELYLNNYSSCLGVVV